MNEELARHDQEIYRYLVQKRFPDGLMKCLACGCTQAYQLGSGRYRCRNEKYTFNLTTGTWFARIKIAETKWLALVRAYDGMALPSEAARSAKTSSATARRAYGVISEATCLHQRRESRNAKMSDDAEFMETLVYGLSEAGGLIEVEPVRNFTPDEARLIQGITLAQLGRFVFTDAALGYDSLAFELPNRSWNHSPKRDKYGRFHHSQTQDFWDFAAQKWVKRGWLEQIPFPDALYELQFRYNHRDRDTCDMLMDILVQPAPAKTC